MINVQILGNLGADAELKEHEGTPYVTFNVASNNFRNKDEVTWVRCALWGSRVEKIAQYLSKGQRVLVIGVLTTRENDEGKTYLNCHCDHVQFAGSSNSDDRDRDDRKSRGSRKRSQKPARGNDREKRRPSSGNEDRNDDNDDIPF